MKRFLLSFLCLFALMLLCSDVFAIVIGYSRTFGGGGTTWTFVSTSSAHSATTTSLEVTAPASISDNDFMGAIVQHRVGEDSTSYPSGWTKLASYTQSTVLVTEFWYKIASSESGNYTWGFSTSARTAATIAVYRGGFDTADPIDTYSNMAYTTSDTNLEAATITVSASNSPLLFVGGAYQSSTIGITEPASPGTFTEDAESYSGDSDIVQGFYSQVISSGATGTIDGTLSIAASYKHAFAISLNPE